MVVVVVVVVVVIVVVVVVVLSYNVLTVVQGDVIVQYMKVPLQDSAPLKSP